MLAAISPADINYGETLSTLHYANRAKNIVNKPIVNEDDNVRVIRELRAEVERLKDLLGGDEEIARLEAERLAAQNALDAAGTDEERSDAQSKLDAASKALSDARGADQALLAAQIAQSEKMMNAMVNDWKGKFDSMTQILEDRGMALKNEGRAVAIESEQPHFVSLNLDDPLATGIVLYYVHEGATTIGRQGLDPEPDIALTHADVQDLHCVVDYDGQEKVILEPKNGSMVLVNGVRVEEATELHQGATVQLGDNTMFRFNHPVEATRLRAAGGTGASHGGAKRLV
jgi:kinesin family protein 16B